MPVALKDIAERLDVSISTVSKALNNKPGVGDELRQRIIETADEMDFRPKQTLRGVSRASTDLVNIILRSNENYSSDPFYSLIAESLAQELQHSDVRSVLTILSKSPVEVSDLVDPDKTDGLAVIGAALSGDFLEDVRCLELPTVLVDNRYDGLSSVNTDNAGGAQVAVDHLTSLDHTAIACLTGPHEQLSQIERCRGYRTGLTNAGLQLNNDLVIECTGVGVDDGYEGIMSLDKIDFSAIFAATDKLAIGAMKALRERGLAVGNDISVIGYDDIEWGLYTMPALSTVAIAKQQIGRMAGQILQNLIFDDSMVPMHMQVATELIIRDSTSRYERK